MKPNGSLQKQALSWVATGAFGAWAASWALAIPTPVPSLEQPNWICEAAHWLDTPAMHGNQAVGKMLVECSLSGTATHDMGALYDGWVRDLKITHEIVSAPTATVPDAQAVGLRFDLIEKIRDDGNGALTIEKDAQVTSDRRNRFTYLSQSKKIEGRGNSSYLRSLTTSIEVKRVPGTKSQFSLRYSDQLAVERPWFAPDQIFINELARQSLTNFERAREKLTANLLTNLQPRAQTVALRSNR